MTTWLERIWTAFTRVALNGTLLPKRTTVNFLGAAVTIADNEAQDRLDITISIPGSAALDNATPSATPDTIVLRNSFGAASFAGQCGFVGIVASGGITANGELVAVQNLVVGQAALYTASMVGGIALRTGTPPDDTPDDGFFLWSAGASGARFRTLTGTEITLGPTSTFEAISCTTLTTTGNATIGDNTGDAHTVNGSMTIGGTMTCSQGTVNTNLSVGASPSFGGGSRVLFLGERTVAPSGTISGGGVLYIEGTNLYVRIGSTRYNISKVVA